MMPTLLQYGPISNIINFLHFYETHHTLEEIPKPTIRTMDAGYATVEERTIAMQHHTTSLQRPENSRIKIYTKCLESIQIIPTASYDKQVEENKHLLNVKKLSSEIIMGKSTEDTAMELDGEGAANFKQLQDLIRKECDKRDRKYARLVEKSNSELHYNVCNCCATVCGEDGKPMGVEVLTCYDDSEEEEDDDENNNQKLRYEKPNVE